MIKKIHSLLLVSLLSCIITGCDISPSSDATVTPDIIRIGPLPDHEPAIMRERYQPVVDYLASQTGIKAELVIADSYQHLLELFHTGKIDIANFGAVTFIKARKVDGARPMVLRDIDGKFTSVVLVNDEITGNDLQSLQGKRFTFGSELSTSGHLMPRYFFSKLNIVPEEFFSHIEFSGAHDKTAYMVRDKKVSGGVSNAGIVAEMYRDGRLKKSEVRVLWESPTYADYVWAIQPTISDDVKRSIESAFLNLQPSNPEHNILLGKLGAAYYVTANDSDFVQLESVFNDLVQQGIIK